jgi:hypothetical protein
MNRGKKFQDKKFLPKNLRNFKKVNSPNLFVKIQLLKQKKEVENNMGEKSFLFAC